MKTLNHAQKQAVKDMGFGEFSEHFNVTSVPTILGQWVVENYNPETNKIMMQDGKEIITTASSIHDMLGVPMGSIPVRTVEKARYTDSIISVWRSQYDIDNSRFYAKILVNKMMEQQAADFNFKLNFLVLFVTYMGECISCGTVNQRFLPFITKEEDIRNMDWCSFLLKCMNTTRRTWNCKSNFNGPLTLLVLLYVNSAYFKGKKVQIGKPAMKFWNADKLIEREKEEIEFGGFGKLEVVGKEGEQKEQKKVKSNFTKMTAKRQKEHKTNDDAKGNESDSEAIINLRRNADVVLEKNPVKRKKLTVKKADVVIQTELTPEKDKKSLGEGSLKELEAEFGYQKILEQLSTPTLKLGIEGLYSCFDENGVYLANSNYHPKTLETYKRSMLTKLSVIKDMQVEVLKTLEDAKVLFPGDIGLKDIDQMMHELFRLDDSEATNKENEKENEMKVMNEGVGSLEKEMNGMNEDVGSLEKEMNDMNEGVDHPEKKTMEKSDDKTKRKLSFELPSFSLNITQLHDQDNEPDIQSELQDEDMDFLNTVIKNSPFLMSQDDPQNKESLKAGTGVEIKKAENKHVVKKNEKNVTKETELAKIDNTEKLEKKHECKKIDNAEKVEKKQEGKIVEKVYKKQEHKKVVNVKKVDKVDKKLEGKKVEEIEKVDNVEKVNKVEKPDRKNVDKAEKGEKKETETKAEKKDDVEKSKEGNLNTPDTKIQPIPNTSSSKVEGIPTGKKFLNPNPKLTLRKSPRTIEKMKQGNTSAKIEMKIGKALEVEPIRSVYPENMQKEKRETQLSTIMVSPYVARPVSLKKAMAAAERRISESIFSAWKPSNDIVFHSHNLDVERVMFENMYPGLAIANGTINIWTLVLNNEETKRNRAKYSRLFCNTSMMNDDLMTHDSDNTFISEFFASSMKSVLLSSPFASLEEVDLVCFPIYSKAKAHFYLICYNLKACEIHILDNIKSKEQDVFTIYGNLPKELTRVFSEGTIFVMRHMETFKGPKDFVTDFQKEGEGQQKQINELRVKYVTKMILSELNDKKHEMVKEAEEFERLPLAEKERLKKEAFGKISKNVAAMVISF